MKTKVPKTNRQLTIPRLIDFISADLDILRDFWQIRKDKSQTTKKGITLEDVKNFIHKLDSLIEFWHRLQILNGDSSLSDESSCLKCDLQKRSFKENLKQKEISCQTENQDERNVVSSSNENNELINSTDAEPSPSNNTSSENQSRIGDKDTKIDESSEVTKEIKSKRIQPKTSRKRKNVSEDKQHSLNLELADAIVEEILTTPTDVSQQVTSPDQSQGNVSSNSAGLEPNSSDRVIENDDTTSKTAKNNSQLEVEISNDTEISSPFVNITEEDMTEENVVEEDMVEETDLNPTPIPSPALSFGFGEESLHTKIEIEEDSPVAMVSIHLENSIKSETEEPTSSPFCQIPQNSNITTSNDLDKNNDEANVNSSETVQNTAIEKEKSPSVIIDRSLADRVSKLMKQGIQVQFNHQGVETIKDRSKSPEEDVIPESSGSPQKTSPTISSQGDEENLERCRKYLLDRLKPNKKNKKRKRLQHQMQQRFNSMPN